MTDWGAIGAIATIATVAIGIWQIRSAKSVNRPVVHAAEPPTLEYRIERSSGSYRFPENWQVGIEHDCWAVQRQIESDLRRINFCVARIYNENKFVVRNVALELRGATLWSANVDTAKTLATSAIRLTMSDDRLKIVIDEMPAGEEVKLSCTAGGGLFGTINTLNAAVKLKNRGLWDA